MTLGEVARVNVPPRIARDVARSELGHYVLHAVVRARLMMGRAFVALLKEGPNK